MDLTLKTRSRILVGKKSKALRAREILPAVVYGHGIETKNIEIKKNSFEKFYKQVGAGNLLDLIIDNQNPVKVLIQGIQRDPVKNGITHIDFYQIKKGEKITHSVKLNFIGESRAVKELNGMLVKNSNSVEIECLPENLISEIDVDISSLNDFDDVICVKDLKVPSNIKMMDRLDEVLAIVVPLRKEEVKEVAAEEKKVVEKKEKK
ncbi:MAG: 50S ribosomal protein L25 [Patescibacteria group bacterium]